MIQTFTVDLGISFDDLKTLLSDRENDFGTLIQFVKEPVNGTLENAALFDSAAVASSPLVLQQFPNIDTSDEMDVANNILTLQEQQGLILTSYAVASIGNADHWIAILRQLTTGQTPPGPGIGGSNIVASEFGGGSDFPMKSAYGGIVDPNAPQVALPGRLLPQNRNVQVRRSDGQGSWIACKVNDVGPWNVDDPYWTTGRRPAAESERRNGTRAQNGLVPTNDAAIDLTPAVMVALGVQGPLNTRTTTVDWQFV